MAAAASPPPTNLERLLALEKLCAEQGRRIDDLERILGAIGAVFTGGGAEVADDDDLDSRFGDPIVKKDPTQTYWKGPGGYVNKHLSECTPEYLDAYAKYKDVCAKLKERDGSAEKKKYAAFDRKDAARARGWAKRLRSGWTPPPKPERPTFGGTGGGLANGTGGNPFARSASNPFGGGGGGGLGASRAAMPPSPPAEASSQDRHDDEPMGDDDFPFGANVTPTEEDDEEELPL